MEVLMFTSCIGVHTITESVPILMEELANHEAAQAKVQ
jgi:hypothetical protein